MTNPTGSILLRRGPTSDRLAFVPLDGEIIYDTDQKKVYVGDGTTYGGKTVTSDITISGTGQVLNIPNNALQNSTISGVALGGNLYALTIGTHLTGTSYNGSSAVSLGVDATDANTAGKIVARDSSGNFSAGTITATLNGNATSATTATTATTASSVTNGVYTTGSYANPSWITSLSETKVLPSQTGNSGKFLSTNGLTTGWVSAAAIGFPSIVGNSGKFLSTDGTTVTWTSPNNGTLSLSTSGVGIDVASTTFTANQSGNASFVVSSSATQNNIPSTIVYRDDSGNFSAGTITASITGSLVGNVVGNVVGSLTGNADTVTNGVVTTGSYANPSWITALSIAQGGSGANNKADALTNFLPTGESVGYVLKTTGRGSYFWSQETGGAGTVGNTISTVRNTFTATAGQTLFSGTGTYTPGAGQLRVYIDGVRQFPSEYTETSSTSFTLTVGVPANTVVFAEVDGYTNVSTPASSIVFSPVGSITATNTQLAVTQLELAKAPLASPTFTGTVTIPAGASISGYAPLASPTFTGTVGGITAAMVGLGNVTNESKSTMFTSPILTGNINLNGYASVKTLIEQATVTPSAPTLITNFDVATQGVQYYTANTTTSFTLNIQGNSLGVQLSSILGLGQSISIGLLVTCASSLHYLSSITIDGIVTNVSVKWQGGATPSAGNASSIDVYTLTVIKTANTPAYTVLGTQTKFA